MNQPVVTIVLPVYNAEEYLPGCIESIISQKYAKLELLLIDDGSVDRSAEICERFSEKDSRIRYVRQSNQGVSAARNLGLQYAAGEYVTFVDADDMLRPDAIEALLSAMDEDTDLVIGSYERFRFGAGQKVVHGSRVFSAEDIRTQFAQLDKLIDCPWGKLFRRSVISCNSLAFDRNIPYGEDHIFNIAFCCCARSVKVIGDVVYRYRLGGIASSVKYHPNMHRLSAAILDTYETFGGKVGIFSEAYLRQKIRDQLCGTIMHYICHCSCTEARSKIAETLEVFARYTDENALDPELYPADLRRYILAGDPKGIASSFTKRNWKRIVLKRAKLFCYKCFKRKHK